MCTSEHRRGVGGGRCGAAALILGGRPIGFSATGYRAMRAAGQKMCRSSGLRCPADEGSPRVTSKLVLGLSRQQPGRKFRGPLNQKPHLLRARVDAHLSDVSEPHGIASVRVPQQRNLDDQSQVILAADLRR